MKTDMQLHKDVLAELTWDPQLNEKEIGVAAKDGVVTLTGWVASYAEKLAAERATERVAGVKAVANDLTVKIPSNFARSDTELAHRIVDALVWDVEVPDEKITASVTNGWVTLEGEVEWQYQRDAAARAARNLAGVHGVYNNIHVMAKRVSSDEVSQSIKEALERRADRTASHIIVDTKDGVVTLTGSVPSYGDRRAAEGAAWSAPGVTEVRDALAVVF
ncbi:MAG: BON domain-containing protein [Gemmatimonas sp.]|nr:BON domain-containing protein [Gemmatimonadaceae bacterium]